MRLGTGKAEREEAGVATGEAGGAAGVGQEGLRAFKGLCLGRICKSKTLEVKGTLSLS